MAPVNWIIVGGYAVFMIWLGFRIGRSQKSQEEYYLGGRTIPFWLVGSSLMANQVSTISLIGAPAFIALREGGGMIWLQYELAVPLAMIVIILVLLPVFWKHGGTTIYEYLETRFGVPSRLALGFIFLLNRSLGAGVILLATSYVSSVLLGLGIVPTILLIGVISLVYTSMGGIKGRHLQRPDTTRHPVAQEAWSASGSCSTSRPRIYLSGGSKRRGWRSSTLPPRGSGTAGPFRSGRCSSGGYSSMCPTMAATRARHSASFPRGTRTGRRRPLC